jgi:hypothetical protein
MVRRTRHAQRGHALAEQWTGDGLRNRPFHRPRYLKSPAGRGGSGGMNTFGGRAVLLVAARAGWRTMEGGRLPRRHTFRSGRPHGPLVLRNDRRGPACFRPSGRPPRRTEAVRGSGTQRQCAAAVGGARRPGARRERPHPRGAGVGAGPAVRQDRRHPLVAAVGLPYRGGALRVAPDVHPVRPARVTAQPGALPQAVHAAGPPEDDRPAVGRAAAPGLRKAGRPREDQRGTRPRRAAGTPAGRPPPVRAPPRGTGTPRRPRRTAPGTPAGPRDAS